MERGKEYQSRVRRHDWRPEGERELLDFCEIAVAKSAFGVGLISGGGTVILPGRRPLTRTRVAKSAIVSR
jgi:hypothetical protein